MRTLFIALLALVACSALAAAQTHQVNSLSDDVQNGHYLAVLICSNCHVASPDQSIEPILQPPAPSFESIAKRSTTTSETIRAFLSNASEPPQPRGYAEPRTPRLSNKATGGLSFEPAQTVCYCT